MKDFCFPRCAGCGFASVLRFEGAAPQSATSMMKMARANARGYAWLCLAMQQFQVSGNFLGLWRLKYPQPAFIDFALLAVVSVRKSDQG